MTKNVKCLSLAVVISCLGFSIACGGGATDPTGASDDGTTGATISVTGGMISGTISDIEPAVAVYRGIPYAAAPTGQLRWRPPQAVEPWEGIQAADRWT